ncbi:MAG: GDSL-type esterase/lipase family protein [Blautia sp.]|nr:GDSL-type esterase/lipase family protein [Blautia sp.]
MEKQDKIERFKRLNQFVKPGQILFAGSSLMEQFPIYEFLQDFNLPLTIYNRGVGGYTTTELMENMEPCIYALKPAHIFINIGTNDMNEVDYTCEGLIENYRRILEGIRKNLPDTKLYLLSYYPVNPSAAKNDPVMQEVLKIRTNARISEANKAVAALAEELRATYLDVNAGITDENGNLKEEYTIEGMHMYANGYKPVFDTLRPVLESLG